MYVWVVLEQLTRFHPGHACLIKNAIKLWKHSKNEALRRSRIAETMFLGMIPT
jgi:hypothetical protein